MGDSQDEGVAIGKSIKYKVSKAAEGAGSCE